MFLAACRLVRIFFTICMHQLNYNLSKMRADDEYWEIERQFFYFKQDSLWRGYAAWAFSTRFYIDHVLTMPGIKWKYKFHSWLLHYLHTHMKQKFKKFDCRVEHISITTVLHICSLFSFSSVKGYNAVQIANSFFATPADLSNTSKSVLT